MMGWALVNPPPNAMCRGPVGGGGVSRGGAGGSGTHEGPCTHPVVPPVVMWCPPPPSDVLERLCTAGGGGGPPPPPPRAGESLPPRSNSTRKGTHHVVKRPDQAGRRGPARGPTHLHPTRDTTVNPTTTRSYVEVVRGVAQRSGRPATVRGPPHVTRYILLPRAPTHPPQPPSAQQRHEGEGRGFVLRSPKDGLSAGTWRRKVVMCPRRGNDPASGHPRAHQPPLGRGTSPPAWDGRLDAPGQRRRHLPSSAGTRRREVKQGKSGGSVGTTDQGKGKGRSVVRPMGTVAYRGKGQGKGKGRGEGRLGQGGRGRSKGGEKLMGTTAYGGKGSKGRAANGDRPVGAASCRRDHHTMASCQNPPPPLPMFEADSQTFASAPSMPRGFEPQKVWPPFGRGPQGDPLGGGGVPAKPPSDPPPPVHGRGRALDAPVKGGGGAHDQPSGQGLPPPLCPRPPFNGQ